MLNINAYEKVSFATCQNYLIFVVMEQTLLQVSTDAWEPELQGTSMVVLEAMSYEGEVVG